VRKANVAAHLSDSMVSNYHQLDAIHLASLATVVLSFGKLEAGSLSGGRS
jgi:hypothetical protein